ncbi:MAG: hypothetical protein MR272_07050 [Pseudoflavonifractor sp.]|nr:hypothetical protein [Pseudoflavonifractor sp.]MDY3019323.1 hypothetical protein [Oscillospiraceae bacterium]
MKGNGWALLLAVVLAARGVGLLPRGREMEELTLVSALAADRAGAAVAVTAVTGVRASQDEEPQVLTGKGQSLAEACRGLGKKGSAVPYLGQADRLLVGEDLARTGLWETLDFVLTDRELRLDTLLYIVRGSAGAALSDAAAQAAKEGGTEDPRGRTVGETLSRLAEGEYAPVPVLEPDGDGALEPAGWAAVGPEGLVRLWTGEAAQGAELLAGLGKGTVVPLPDGSAAALTGVRTWAKDGEVRCTLTAQSVRGEAQEAALEVWGERQIRAVLSDRLDCWGLDRERGALRPWAWGHIENAPVEELAVKVTGRIEGSYERRS